VGAWCRFRNPASSCRWSARTLTPEPHEQRSWIRVAYGARSSVCGGCSKASGGRSGRGCASRAHQGRRGPSLVHGRAPTLLPCVVPAPLQELARYGIDSRNIVINQVIFPEAGAAPLPRRSPHLTSPLALAAPPPAPCYSRAATQRRPWVSVRDVHIALLE
jgi:hypothetical protein